LETDVAGAIPVFVVGEGDLFSQFENGAGAAGEDGGADGHVSLDLGVLVWSQAAGFEQDLVGSANFAEVVEGRGQTYHFDLVLRESQLGGDERGKPPDPPSVAAGGVIAVFAREGEAFDYLPLRGFEFRGTFGDALFKQLVVIVKEPVEMASVQVVTDTECYFSEVEGFGKEVGGSGCESIALGLGRGVGG
jgi:hypothetical protein